MVALAPGESLNEVNDNTLVIAVDVPNRDIITNDWQAYQTTVDRIELATGYDLLSNLPLEVQETLEASESAPESLILQ